jgi:hypothetical protein
LLFCKLFFLCHQFLSIVYIVLFLFFFFVCFVSFSALSIFHWNTLHASDRDVIRMALLSSVIYFILQTIGKCTCTQPLAPLPPNSTPSPLLLIHSFPRRVRPHFLCVRLSFCSNSFFFSLHFESSATALKHAG